MTELSATDRRLAVLEQRQDEQQRVLARLESRLGGGAPDSAAPQPRALANPLLTLSLVAGATLLVLALAQHMHLGRALRHLF